MDGDSDQALVSALDGNAPAQKDQLAGPSSTSSSSGRIQVAPQDVAASTSSTARPPRPPRSTTTTTTRPPRPQPTLPVTYSYAGAWDGSMKALVPTAVAAGHRTLLGTMTAFSTQDPRLSCLGNGPPLNVYSVASDPGQDYVIARAVVGDCTDAAFAFSVPLPPPTSTTTTSSSTTSTTTTTSAP
jgi:hypothetical protein